MKERHAMKETPAMDSVAAGRSAMVKPTFIVPGAPKCGTTALWEHLNDHPEIGMASIKEPRFFSRAEGTLERGVMADGPNRSGQYHRGWDWYEALFSHCTEARARGEASTHYFSDPDTPALLARNVPSVKLIVLVRDPVQRVYSHYWQEHKLGWPLPSFPMMVQEDHPRLRFYCRVSAYRHNLERFLEHVPRERVLLLLLDDLKNHPLATARRAYRFLGVDDTYDPSTVGARYNQQTAPRSRWLERAMEAARYHVADALPRPVRAALGALRRQVSLLNAEPKAVTRLDPRLRAHLLPRFESDTRYVEAWLGRDLDAWRAVENV